MTRLGALAVVLLLAVVVMLVLVAASLQADDPGQAIACALVALVLVQLGRD